MAAKELRIEDPVEALIVEQALAMARELKRTCRLAPDGQVLAAAEQVALAQGRELTRRSLEAVLEAERADVEKKGRAAEPAPAAQRGSIGGSARGRC
jgi:hypothetical protein